VKSKYRNPCFGHCETPAARHKPIYFLFFSVTLWLRGVLLLFGCGFVALHFKVLDLIRVDSPA